MANMFDVSTTMSSVADDQVRQMDEIQGQVSAISARVDSVKSYVESSMASVDDSISRIEDITDNILSTTQDAVQEQSRQFQIIEAEKEVEDLKFKNNGEKAEDPSYEIKLIKQAIESMNVDVSRLLDAPKNSKREVADIGSSAISALGNALTLIFGGAVIASLFAGGSEEQKAEEASDQSDNATVETVGSNNAEPKEETATVQETSDQSGTALQSVMQQSEAEKTVEELPAVEPDREIARVAMEDSKQPERKVMTDEEIQKLSDERNAVLREQERERYKEIKVEVLETRRQAMESGKPIKKNGIYYEPNGDIIELTEKGNENRAAVIIQETDSSVKNLWAIEDTPENRKLYPGLWDSTEISSNTPVTGSKLVESQSQVEKSESATRSSVSQTIVNVVNQPAQQPQKEPTKPVVVIGKTTADKILR